MVVRSLRAALLVGAMLLTQAMPVVATCPPDAGCGMTTRVYPVADLVIPVGGDQAKTLEGNLMTTIESAICPRSWSSAGAGGSGGVHYHPLTHSLVVSQTSEVHERIA